MASRRRALTAVHWSLGALAALALALMLLLALLGCGFDWQGDPGSIRVRSTPPGAEISLQWGDTGHVTPCTLTNLALIRYDITLELQGYQPYQTSVELTAHNKSTTVNAVLTPLASGG